MPPRLFALANTLALPLLSTLPVTASDFLELDEHGLVSIVTNEAGTLGLSVGLTDFSEGHWKRPPTFPTFEPQSGSEIDWSGEYGFPDRSFVEFNLHAQIKGSNVGFKSSWPTESKAPGFGLMVLIIPQEVAEDLTVEAKGQVMFANFETVNSAFFEPGAEVVFRKSSTGEFLFKFSSEDSGSGLLFWPENKENGLHLRIGGPADDKALVSDVTQLSGVLAFQE